MIGIASVCHQHVILSRHAMIQLLTMGCNLQDRRKQVFQPSMYKRMKTTAAPSFACCSARSLQLVLHSKEHGSHAEWHSMNPTYRRQLELFPSPRMHWWTLMSCLLIADRISLLRKPSRSSNNNDLYDALVE